MIHYAIIALASLLAVLTLLPLSRHDAWWIRGLDFPRLQIAIALVALLAGELATMDLSATDTRLIIGVTASCLAYQAWWIVPHTQLYPREVKQCVEADSDNTIRLMNANVLTPNRQSEALLRIVRDNDPDILVTLETDKWWEEKLSVLEADYPHTIKCPLDNLYGMHVYSRLALNNSEIQFLVEPDKPSMHTEVTLQSGQCITIHFLHPAPPSPTENDTSGERDAELLIVAKSISRVSTPVIVVGDLNDVAWSTTTRLFRKLSGLLDPRVGRGMFNTFNSRYWFVRWPLDHVFHSNHFTVSRIVRLPDFGSDHFPLLTELVFAPEHGADQSGLDADASDKALADEKTQKKAVSDADVHEPDQ